MTDFVETDSVPTSSADPKIHGDMIKLRKKVGGVQAVKKAGGPNFAVKSAAELMIRFREAIDKLKMVVGVVEAIPQVVFAGETGGIHQSTAGRFQWICVCTVKLRFYSDDGSYMDFVGVGNGGDTQDKAAGKAFTYAWKSAVIVALSAPDKDMKDCDDEVPFEESVPTEKRGPGRPRKIDTAARVVVEGAEVVKDTGPASTSAVDTFVRMFSEAQNEKVLGVIAAKVTAADWTDEEATALQAAYKVAVERLGV